MAAEDIENKWNLSIRPQYDHYTNFLCILGNGIEEQAWRI